MNALAVVKMLVIIVVAFRAGLKRKVQGPEILASMLGMAGGASDAGFSMCGNNSSGETFALMAAGAISVHFLLIRNTDPDGMAGSTRITNRLFGDGRH